MGDIQLIEEVPTRISSVMLSEAAALELAGSKRFEVTFPSPLTSGQFEIRSRGWVGHFPLSTGDVVRVQPKVPVSNVLQMLDIAYGFKGFNLDGAAIDVNDLQSATGQLASILAKRVAARCTKGLYGSYIKRDEALPYVRGRIDPLSIVTARDQGRLALHCQYEEFTQDVKDNQILLWALHLLSRADLPAFAKVSVRAAYRALHHTVSLVPIHRKDLVDRTYNALNQDYAILHALCRFFLDNLSPGLRQGDRGSIPFSIYMPGLFERFAFEWLMPRLPADVSIGMQWHEEVPGDFSVIVKPDLVISDRATRRAFAVIDTKYKFGEKPKQGDIFQVVSYANHLRVDKAFLLYPSRSSLQATRLGDISVKTMFFDLTQDVACSGNECLQFLMKELDAVRAPRPQLHK